MTNPGRQVETDALEAMVTSVSKLTQEATNLRTEVTKEVERKSRRNLIIFSVPIIVLLIVAGFTVYKVQQLQKLGDQNRKVNQSNQQLVIQVKDCIDPTGTCYKRNQQTTNDAINKIIEGVRNQPKK